METGPAVPLDAAAVQGPRQRQMRRKSPGLTKFLLSYRTNSAPGWLKPPFQPLCMPLFQ